VSQGALRSSVIRKLKLSCFGVRFALTALVPTDSQTADLLIWLRCAECVASFSADLRVIDGDIEVVDDVHWRHVLKVWLRTAHRVNISCLDNQFGFAFLH
jgi:hypothetical protein